jgi:hypothetical protein
MPGITCHGRDEVHTHSANSIETLIKVKIKNTYIHIPLFISLNKFYRATFLWHSILNTFSAELSLRPNLPIKIGSFGRCFYAGSRYNYEQTWPAAGCTGTIIRICIILGHPHPKKTPIFILFVVLCVPLVKISMVK